MCTADEEREEVLLQLSTGQSTVTVLVSVLVLSTLFLSTSCSSPVTPTPSYTSPTASATSVPTSGSGLTLLQQNGSLAVSFKAMVLINVNGNTVDYVSDYFVPSIPITWTGTSFNGRLEERGPDRHAAIRVKVESGSNLNAVQIDWSNTGGGSMPALAVTFSK